MLRSNPSSMEGQTRACWFRPPSMEGQARVCWFRLVYARAFAFAFAFALTAGTNVTNSRKVPETFRKGTLQ